MKQILVINGHPTEGSYCAALGNAYSRGAKSAKHNVETINIRDMDFNPNLMFGYNKRMELEADVEDAINKIQNSDHIVWVYPLWWQAPPALLKGFIDRTFLPGIAFKSGKSKLPEKLFKGKSSRIIITSDSPRWYNYLYLKNPAINQLKKGTLGFTGIKPVKVTYISPINNSKDKYRAKWIEKVNQLGQQEI
jgi:putative NADPH-quinone reductase